MLRKFLMASALVCAAAGSAFAADLPNTKEAPVYAPPPPPVFSWTGVYIGGQVGYQWGSASPSLVTPGAAYTGLPGNNLDGVVGGGHVGYNLQVQQFVFGLEGDVDGSNYSGGNSNGAVAYTTREPVEASIRGRIGYAWDRVLFYGTGGVAFGDFNNTYTGPGGGVDNVWDTRVGWTAGAGIEYAIDNNWSVRAEYRYTDFGDLNDYLANSAPGSYVHLHETDNRVQVGFSYKFDLFGPPGPMAAKY
jgi:outer membrane immunogenic protein